MYVNSMYFIVSFLLRMSRTATPRIDKRRKKKLPCGVPGDGISLISDVYRAEWARVLATLIRLTGDFSLAEEATQDAFEAALTRWREGGVPEYPRAWLIQTARYFAIDRLRARRCCPPSSRPTPSPSMKRSRPRTPSRSRTICFDSSSPAATRPWRW